MTGNEYCNICVPVSSSFFNLRRLCPDCSLSFHTLLKLIARDNGRTKITGCFATREELDYAIEFVNDLHSQKDRLDFLAELSRAFRDQVHTDILLQSADHAPAIAAHKAVLATRSNIFKNMLDSDSCKAPPGDAITLPEMNHEELDAFLDFLYSGQLTKEVLQMHISSLMRAAHKYDIPFLKSYCENEILKGLGVNNALDALELADACSNHKLKAAVIDFAVENLKDIILSPKFDEFALARPRLSLEIMKASVMNPKP